MYLQWYLELLRESRGIPQIGERSNVTKSKKSVDWQLEKELIILYMAEGKIPETQ